MQYLKRTFTVFGKVSHDSTLTFSDGKEAVVARGVHQDQEPVGLIPYHPISAALWRWEGFSEMEAAPEDPPSSSFIGSHILWLVCPALLPPPFPLCFTSYPLTNLFCTEYLVLSFKIFMCLCVHLDVMCVGASEAGRSVGAPWAGVMGRSEEPNLALLEEQQVLLIDELPLWPHETPWWGRGKEREERNGQWRNELILKRLSRLLSKT